MKIDLTEKQLESIFSQLTVNRTVDLLGKTPNASLDVICKFIYYYARERWMQDKIKEVLESTPIQMELFPEGNTT